jgi:hypothetical protein
MGRIVDINGRRFGSLLVVGISHRDKARQVRWSCLCDCGRILSLRGGDLRNGRSKSCGCKKGQYMSIGLSVHGGTRTRIYHTWRNMIGRCEQTTTRNFQSYGSRGIKVCKEWRHDFPAFRDWALSHGYSETLTIDRVDNDGDYSPSNCQWITGSENSRKAHLGKKEARKVS